MLKYVSSNVSFRISCKRSFKLFPSLPLKSPHRSLLTSRTAQSCRPTIEDHGWRLAASDFSRTVISGGWAHLRPIQSLKLKTQFKSRLQLSAALLKNQWARIHELLATSKKTVLQLRQSRGHWFIREMDTRICLNQGISSVLNDVKVVDRLDFLLFPSGTMTRANFTLSLLQQKCC